jgi:hypothetical protein
MDEWLQFSRDVEQDHRYSLKKYNMTIQYHISSHYWPSLLEKDIH